MHRVINIPPTCGRIIRSPSVQLVAIESFVDCDGDLIQAGISMASPEADCVRERPSAWTAWDGTLDMLDRIQDGKLPIQRSRDHIPAPAPEPVEVRVPALDMKNTSPVEVRVAPTARQRMLDELFYLTRSDGLEAGGFLFSDRTRTFDKQVRVMIATPSRGGNLTQIPIVACRSCNSSRGAGNRVRRHRRQPRRAFYKNELKGVDAEPAGPLGPLTLRPLRSVSPAVYDESRTMRRPT